MARAKRVKRDLALVALNNRADVIRRAGRHAEELHLFNEQIGQLLDKLESDIRFIRMEDREAGELDQTIARFGAHP